MDGERVKRKGLDVNCIITIKGVTTAEYVSIREDMMGQFLERGIAPQEMPFFALLPADYTEIDVVWFDEEMEKSHFAEALRQSIPGKLN